MSKKIKVIHGRDVLKSYNNLYHELDRAVQTDCDHFSNKYDEWLDKICTHLQSDKNLKGLVSLSTNNYMGKRTKALLMLLDIKGVRTIGALAEKLLEKFDMLRAKVSMTKSDTCPYCKKMMDATEGASGMDDNGICTIWCAYCGGAYYYVDEAIKANYIRSQKSVEVNMSKKIKINTKVPLDIMLTVINPGGSDNCYDNKAPIDWDVDDFVGYVSDHMDSDYGISLDKPLLKAIFKSKVTMDILNTGSGYNNDTEFKKYGNWRSALYDIWTVVLKDSKPTKKDIHCKTFDMNDIADKVSKILTTVKAVKYPDEITQLKHEIIQKDLSKLHLTKKKGADDLQSILNTIEALSENIHDLNDNLSDLQLIIEEIKGVS